MKVPLTSYKKKTKKQFKSVQIEVAHTDKNEPSGFQSKHIFFLQFNQNGFRQNS